MIRRLFEKPNQLSAYSAIIFVLFCLKHNSMCETYFGVLVAFISTMFADSIIIINEMVCKQSCWAFAKDDALYLNGVDRINGFCFNINKSWIECEEVICLSRPFQFIIFNSQTNQIALVNEDFILFAFTSIYLRWKAFELCVYVKVCWAQCVQNDFEGVKHFEFMT